MDDLVEGRGSLVKFVVVLEIKGGGFDTHLVAWCWLLGKWTRQQLESRIDGFVGGRVGLVKFGMLCWRSRVVGLILVWLLGKWTRQQLESRGDGFVGGRVRLVKFGMLCWRTRLVGF
jgi:hypothetical protein